MRRCEYFLNEGDEKDVELMAESLETDLSNTEFDVVYEDGDLEIHGEGLSAHLDERRGRVEYKGSVKARSMGVRLVQSRFISSGFLSNASSTMYKQA